MMPTASHQNPLQTTWFIGLLMGFGMFFNALLAIANAHGVGISSAHVIAMEVLTMGAVVVTVFPARNASMRPWTAFLYMFVLIFVWLLLFNAVLGQSVSPKPLRDVMLITVFGLLGIVCYDKNVDIIKIIRVICICVVVVMLFENYMTEQYSSLFSVANYYINTRGLEDRSIAGLDDLGLFVNTGLIEGRFTLGFLTSHRLSSLFLEQTTLGNFSVVISMATSIFWDKLTRKDKIILIGTVILTIMGTDSRLALGFALATLIGHWSFHKLPRHLNLVIMPFILIISWMTLYTPYQMQLTGDDLPGRFSWSLTQLSHLDWQGLFGGRPDQIGKNMDAGYAYFIYSQTIVGMIILWLFTCMILPSTTVQARRLSMLLSLFIAVNYMVGATLFSIKIAALLWVIVGYVYKQAYDAKPTPTLAKPA